MLESESSVQIRESCPGDAQELADVFRSSWHQAYQGVIPHLELERLIKRRGCCWWEKSLRHGEGTLVLEVAGTIAGYASCGTARRKGQFKGEIFELYLAPDYQGAGYGEHLFEACRYHLDMRQYQGLAVWALADNTAACDFYWRRGGRPFDRSFEIFGKTKLEKNRFRLALICLTPEESAPAGRRNATGRLAP